MVAATVMLGMVVDDYVLASDLELLPHLVVPERGSARGMVSPSDGSVRHEYAAE